MRVARVASAHEYVHHVVNMNLSFFERQIPLRREGPRQIRMTGYWGAVQEVSDRNGGTYRLPGRPWHFSRDELAPLGDPAFQGEHNRDVFHELGLSDDEIDGYIASGALVGVSVPAAVADQSRAVA